MSSSKWLVMFGVSIILALLLIVGANVLVDPFGVFGDPIFDWYSYNETNNPRVAKLAYLEEHHDEYDSYIIGSSSAASYSVDELNEYLDARFYNLFVYGCDTKDYLEFASFVLANYEVKNLVLNLGINEAASFDTGEGELNNQMHALANGENLIKFYFQYAFCNPQYTLDKVISYFRDTELPQVFDVFEVLSGCYDKRVRDIEKIGDPDVYAKKHGGDFTVSGDSADLAYIEECVGVVAAIRDLCAEKNVSLTVIASPVYAAQWDQYEESTLRTYKTSLAAEVDYWDFSCTPITYDSRYFYDATHFRNAVGTMILAEIFGNESVYRPDPFGTYVTKDSCQTYLDSLFSSPPVIAAELYTKEIPILMYHHFSQDASNDMIVTPETFEMHMKTLSEAGYTAVTIPELMDYVNCGGTLPEKPILITIDDGYSSNYETAWPILAAYDMKATIFAIGSSVGKAVYKDTSHDIIPHFSYAQAQEMMASGVIDVQSHTYDMHQSEAYESAKNVRTSILPFRFEPETAYKTALYADMEQYSALWQQELGQEFYALAYPGGYTCDLTEVLVHAAGIPVTFRTVPDSRNVLVRGLPQTLYALCRRNITNDVTAEELLDMVTENWIK